ncbi:riboflavin synthase [Desulfonema magnum]|uniref:Riboflavin synthase n=1 Tax=Desulfonema magnum TaxID=45655 RepID=A0A975GM88_9BACT|nr:riboflavin synthase [Desulfonema magnum]QTA86400.1 Riboflavin synthase [Desulfonema magnum]
MFTGIIEGLGTITSIQSSGQSRRLSLEADFILDNTKIGDSIAVSGACLTAVTLEGKQFKADVSPETLGMTTFGKAKVGDRVNLERALRLSDRLDGHLVSGHIDGTGILKHRKITDNAIIITIGVSESLSRYMIKKGSVAVDGISLTINDCDPYSFSVSIIPHTAKLTTIGFKKIGDPVNIETDMIGKYVEQFVTGKKETGQSSVDMAFLAKNGFL